ncbi:MAG TPA: hypothetical protein VNA89_05515 [Gemmatimonadaceae bacterium]|nr:hypothetical protein [Gemmatimonadaceae bacterium]
MTPAAVRLAAAATAALAAACAGAAARSPLERMPFPCTPPAGQLPPLEGVRRPEVFFLVPRDMIKGWPLNRYEITYGIPGRQLSAELTREFQPVRPPRDAVYETCSLAVGGRRAEVLAYQDYPSVAGRYVLTAQWRDVYAGRDFVLRVRARDEKTYDELRSVLFTVSFPADSAR